MEGHCFCLEDTGELCDGCLFEWTGRHGCITEPTSPPLTPTQPVSDEEMADAADYEEEASALEADHPSGDVDVLASAASVSNAYVPPRRVASVRKDPYGEYLKKQKTAGK